MVVRELSAAHLSVIEAAGQAWAEEGYAPAMEDFAWTWFNATYATDCAIWVAAYSFIKTLAEGVLRSPLLRLLYGAVTGELGEGLWRYSLQWRRIVDAVAMRDPPDFRRVANAVFPGVKPEEARGSAQTTLL